MSYNGYYYSTLADVVPSGLAGATCQSGYKSVPFGWELAPDVAESKAVIAAYTWSTHVLVLSGGYSYNGAGYSTPGGLFSYSSLYTSGTTYAVSGCSLQILIRM